VLIYMASAIAFFFFFANSASLVVPITQTKYYYRTSVLECTLKGYL